MQKNQSSQSNLDQEIFEYKQVLVIRTDLKMGRGKIAVQVAHAAVTAAEIARKHEPSWWQRWLDEGQKKVVVKVSTLKDLLAIYDEAVRSKLPSDIIRDRGLTEIPPGSVTTVGIGPAPTKKVDKITANLPLL